MNRVGMEQASEAAALRAASALKVLIADDHHLVREGLKLALRHLDAEVRIVEAETLRGAVEAYRAQPDFDLVLLDLTMPDGTGIELLEEFGRLCPEARVVVISASYDLQTVREAVRRGVLG